MSVEDGAILPNGYVNNCAIANGDEEKNCQMCPGKCRGRFTGKVVAITGAEEAPPLDFDTAEIGMTAKIDPSTGEMICSADYAIVTIVYFKTTGKYYTSEETKWYRDPTHFSKWKKFDDVVRLKDMIAVCIETPLGYPHMSQPGVSRG